MPDASLMTPSISLGQMTRSPSALEWAIMKDLGWTLVPEPGTILLSACGLLMIGWLRRRN